LATVLHLVDKFPSEIDTQARDHIGRVKPKAESQRTVQHIDQR